MNMNQTKFKREILIKNSNKLTSDQDFYNSSFLIGISLPRMV